MVLRFSAVEVVLSSFLLSFLSYPPALPAFSFTFFFDDTNHCFMFFDPGFLSLTYFLIRMPLFDLFAEVRSSRRINNGS